MPGNTFGQILKFHTFGESHALAIGGIIEGFPAGLKVDFEKINHELRRRKTNQSHLVSGRDEKDEVKFFSGIFEGITTGTPIGFIIENKDAKSKDYDHLREVYRPSHSDFTYEKKYGLRDHRGGGRSSARETTSWVIAGALAKQLISELKITAYVFSIGELSLDKPYQEVDFLQIEKNLVRCPDPILADKMIKLIEETKKQGDSLGGIISCVIKNVPLGLGEPVFEKLQAILAKAMMSIPSVKGFEYGSGFEGTKMRGSMHNDIFINGEKTKTNYSGGIQGGISNGMDIYFRVAFKPVATIMKAQMSINKQGKETLVEGKGRHDPCVLPRAVPIVEAMSALVLADFWLLNKISKL